MTEIYHTAQSVDPVLLSVPLRGQVCAECGITLQAALANAATAWRHPLPGARGSDGIGQTVGTAASVAEPGTAGTMRVQLICHFKPCMTEIYLHIVARISD